MNPDVDMAKAGDVEALERLLAAAEPKMMPVAFRILGDSHLAEDAVQMSLLKIAKCIQKKDDHGNFIGWACRICFNTALTLSMRRREPTLSEEGMTAFVMNAVAPPEANRQDISCRVASCIESLPIKYREVLERKHIDGLTTKQAGEQCGISEKTCEVRLVRARKRLRRELIRLGLRGIPDTRTQGGGVRARPLHSPLSLADVVDARLP